MAEVHLVAVQHDDSGNLISQNLFPVIQNLVLPLLTRDSVLVLEGGKKRGRLNPNDPGYEVMYRQLGPISFSGIRPVIHSDDAMYWNMPEDFIAWALEQNEYAHAVNNFFHFETIPNTWDELIATIREGRHDVEIQGVFPERWQKASKRIAKEFKLRDDTFIDQVKKYERKGKKTFFIGGLLHCIQLHIRRGWPVVMGETNPEVIHSFYRSWYQVYGAHKHFGT